jgi:hypothetical protein
MQVVTFGFAEAAVASALEMSAEEQRHAARVDEIVRGFARTRRWPSLDEKERFYLRERIRFAYEYCRIAETCASRPLLLATRPQIAAPDRRLIEWLLIDVWRQSGVLNWLEPIHLFFSSAARPSSSPDVQLSE